MGTANLKALFVDVNGAAVAADAPAVSALDRGFLYGDGLFETIRAYNGVPFLLADHLERLRASAAELRLVDSLDTEVIAQRLARLLEKCAADDAYVRITVTRGLHTGALDLRPAEAPTIAIMVRPMHPLPPELYERGVDTIVASIRQNVHSPVPRHKTLNYLEKLLAKTQAREQGAYEAILLNTRGHVAEGASSNVFLVRERRLVTPALEANILPGVTRRAVLALAAEAGAEAEERTVTPSEMREADEVFLTNSIVELLPVCAIDGRAVGSGAPGPLTRHLHARYLRQVRQHVDSTSTQQGDPP